MQSAHEPRRRVPPLPPEDRRVAIIEATLPLLEECGVTISTRQIAQAAGVAEGTIFRVFPDKPSLIRATILAATDPARAVTALAAIPADADVRVRVAAIVDVLTERIRQHGRLFALAREMVIDEGLGGEFGQALAETRERTQLAVTKVIEPDASRLRVPPRTVARLLTSLVISASGHMYGEPAHLTRDELVEVLFDGLLKTGCGGNFTHRHRTGRPHIERHRIEKHHDERVNVLIKVLRTYLRPYKGPITLVVLLQLISTLAVLYLPTLNADIIDKGVLTGDSGYIVKLGAVMLAVTLVQIVASIIAVYFGARTAMAAGRDIRAGIFAKVMGFSTREVGRFGAPSLITRTTNDVQQVQMLALMSFTLMVGAPIMCVGGVILALRQDVPLSSLLLVIVPVLAIVVSLIIRKMRPLFRSMQVKVDGVNRVMREQITGIRVIRAFVRDGRERERFDVANSDLRNLGLSTGRLMSLMFPSVMLVINVSSVAVLWFGGHRIADGHMQIGALTAFLSYLMYILMSVMMATFMFIMVPRAEVCAERIQEVLNTETSLEVPSDPIVDITVHGELEIRDASFKYPGAQAPVLHGVHVTAKPGRTTAIIGSTGAGKTTLLNLIPRLFDVTEGEVLVDGVDVRRLDPNTLSRTVGLVPQRPYLFAGTIASNLRYGNPSASDEDLWHALEVAQARGFVEHMDGGLDASIAQGGTNVSGGQRQRLAIARMLVAKPEIYLFDDSFSALDYATDAALRAALAGETGDATVVIVAQRVSTIRDADRIVVLDEGQVVGTGTHSSLMADNETYREIVLSQLTEAEANA